MKAPLLHADDKPATDEGYDRKRLSAFAVAVITFACVSGGPVGIEESVGSGGALMTLVSLVLVGICWSAPQALITAELSTAIPSNGGSIDWVLAAFGWVPGLCNSVSLAFNYLFDLPLYPKLITAALGNVVSLSPVATILVQAGVVVLTCVLNIVGLDAVASSATVLTALVLAPFLLFPVVAAATHQPFNWSALSPSATPASLWQGAGLGLFLSGLLWNVQGWTNAGNLAAEVANPRKSYPRGVAVALLMVTASYGYCIVFGAALHPNLGDWEDGFLVEVGKQVAPWLGICCGVAATIASLSTYITSLAAYSRSLQGMAHDGFVPIPLLGRDMTRFKTPVPAVLVLSVTTAGLMFLDLSRLVLLDTTCANISIVLTVAAFVALRRQRPDLPRPYHVPGGLPCAYAMLLSILALASLALYAVATEDWWAAAIPSAVNVLVAVAAVVGMRLWPAACARCRAPASQPMPEASADAVDGDSTSAHGILTAAGHAGAAKQLLDPDRDPRSDHFGGSSDDSDAALVSIQGALSSAGGPQLYPLVTSGTPVWLIAAASRPSGATASDAPSIANASHSLPRGASPAARMSAAHRSASGSGDAADPMRAPAPALGSAPNISPLRTGGPEPGGHGSPLRIGGRSPGGPLVHRSHSGAGWRVAGSSGTSLPTAPLFMLGESVAGEHSRRRPSGLAAGGPPGREASETELPALHHRSALAASPHATSQSPTLSSSLRGHPAGGSGVVVARGAGRPPVHETPRHG
jgi:amino acid transporter